MSGLCFVFLCFMDVSVVSQKCFNDSLVMCQDVSGMY